MHCEQASQMMSARLDDCLDSTEIDLLEDHLAACSGCQTEWRGLQALDRLLASAPMLHAPLRVRVQVLARLNRREQTRRAIIGSTALALGTVALALLALAPVFLGLLDAVGITPALISGGPATIVQLLTFLRTIGHVLLVLIELVLIERSAVPLASLGLCGLVIALALNGLWVGAVRRLRTAR